MCYYKYSVQEHTHTIYAGRPGYGGSTTVNSNVIFLLYSDAFQMALAVYLWCHVTVEELDEALGAGNIEQVQDASIYTF